MNYVFFLKMQLGIVVYKSGQELFLLMVRGSENLHIARQRFNTSLIQMGPSFIHRLNAIDH